MVFTYFAVLPQIFIHMTFQTGNNINRRFWTSKKRVRYIFEDPCILSLHPFGPNLRDGKT